jgi:hypothetical protein
MDVGGMVMEHDGEVHIYCPFCTCQFSSERDLELHLKAFGRVDHERLVLCVAILSEVDGYKAGVDDHGDWRRNPKVDRLFTGGNVRACRLLVAKGGLVRGERSDTSKVSDD